MNGPAATTLCCSVGATAVEGEAVVEGSVSSPDGHCHFPREQVRREQGGQMIPVNEAEFDARDEAHTAVFYGRVVEHELAGDLEIGREESPEDRVLVIAVSSGVRGFRKELVVVQHDVGTHQVGNDVDDSVMVYECVKSGVVAAGCFD